jgi:hypothetical protein
MSKLNRRDFLIQSAATGFLAGTAFCGRAASAANPFPYDVDRFSRTDPKLIGYEEAGRFDCGGPARALAAGPDHRVYVAHSNRVTAFDGNGRELTRYAGNSPARCVAVTSQGTVYAGFRDKLEVFGAQGTRTASWDLPDKRSWFTGLAVAGDQVFAADAANRRVVRLDASGKVTGFLGVKDKEKHVPGLVVPSPYLKVVLAPDGLLRVNNTGRHCVELYTLEGDLELSWGQAGAGIRNFCGCCNPVGLALLPDGRHVTAEKGLPRVKVYSAKGEFESVVAGPEMFPDNPKAGPGREPGDGIMAGLDVAADADGRVYILDRVAGRVHVMRAKA